MASRSASLTPARGLRYALVAVALGGLLTLALWPQSVTVEMATADTGIVRETLDTEGRTRARERHEIGAPVAGMARRLLLQPGDAVRAGDVLVTIDPAPSPALDARGLAEANARVAAAQARLQAAEQQVMAAHSSTELARAEWQRLQPLAAQGMVSALALQQAESAHERAAAAERAARFQQATAAFERDAARATLRRDGPADRPVQIKAPIDGVVLRRQHESARRVMAGEPLLEIGDPASLEVVADVLSSDAVRLSPGLPVELLRWGGEPALTGEVLRIEPGAFTKTSALGVEEQRVWVVIAIRSPQASWARLGEAYRVQVRFVLAQVNGVLRVPSSAVFAQAEGREAVFQVQGGRSRIAPVETGLRGGGWTAITRGLPDGAQVVLHPPRELADGARVTAQPR